jgi:DNA-binding NarL/FixJ family response regulator
VRERPTDTFRPSESAVDRVNKVRVVIVDDDPLVLAGLRMILGGATDIAVVARRTTDNPPIDAGSREMPDVILMDIRMPRMDSLAATRRLRGRGMTARIIVLTTFDTDEMVLTAFRYGAAGSRRS